MQGDIFVLEGMVAEGFSPSEPLGMVMTTFMEYAVVAAFVSDGSNNIPTLIKTISEFLIQSMIFLLPVI
jgi:hypothetical protein